MPSKKLQSKPLFNYLLLALLAVALAFVITSFKKWQQDPSHNYSHLGGPFTLSSPHGPVQLKSFRGKPVILYFGFTTCPDVCPLALHTLNRVLDRWNPEKRQQLHKVFISVDYKRDGPQKVKEYTEFFADDIIGLAGTKEQIEDISRKYKIYYKFVPLKNSALGYTVDHTSRFYLIDKRGKLQGSFSDIESNSEFTQALEKLL